MFSQQLIQVNDILWHLWQCCGTLVPRDLVLFIAVFYMLWHCGTKISYIIYKIIIGLEMKKTEII